MKITRSSKTCLKFITEKKRELLNEIMDEYARTADFFIKYDILTDIKLISDDELKTVKGKQPFIQEAFRNGQMK